VLAPSHGHGLDDHHHSPDDHHHHDHGDKHDHVHPHNHDHADHSHTPPETITVRSLLALGVSGGLIPCPSALVVMLGAIALNRIGFGLVLVLAFSLGLAGALTAIGMLFIYAGRLFKKYPSSGMVISFVPVLSALFISLIGMGIVYRALVEFGIV
jgi:ABC-type nickel/cobalt efflux system permease component RcnA